MTFLEQLIEEIRKYPILWDKTLEEYRNLIIRDNAWENISEELGKPVNYLKSEWKKLQDSHRQAVLRRKTKSVEAAKKMKPWKYEELMSFLLSDISARETQSNVDIGEYSEENEDSSGLMGGDNQNEEAQTWPELKNKRESGGQKSREAFNKFKKSLDKEGDVDKVIKFLQDKNNAKKRPGELDFFFASACESTKRLHRRLQLKVKEEVMKAIINAETECLDH
uniref:MADF domain-containing protein n=1 Tax=Timema tahoe TaxID=61484 RepID=A0A7R9P0F8_9NEOP|nr:unnamed protein product [Timema tahoe]